MNYFRITIEDESIIDMRVDSYLADHAGILHRSQLKQRTDRIIVNDREAKFSRRVSVGDTVELYYLPPLPVSFDAEDIPLSIIYEDKSVIVVNKPRGMVVHPAAGNSHGTLVQALLHHCSELRLMKEADPIRPGIVHRLDKDTSGVIIAAKDVDSQEFLSLQFRKRRTHKRYYAIVKNEVYPGEGCIDRNIRRDPIHRKKFAVCEDDGKTAVTEYRVLARRNGYSFVSLHPVTGRTHQLRVHMQSNGSPILGDPLYARRDASFRDTPLMLHAYSLTITIPGTDEPRTFRAPLPQDFRDTWNAVARPK